MTGLTENGRKLCLTVKIYAFLIPAFALSRMFQSRDLAEVRIWASVYRSRTPGKTRRNYP